MGASYVVYVYIAVFIIFEVIFEIVKMRERNQIEDAKYEMKIIEGEEKKQMSGESHKFSRIRFFLLIGQLVALGVLALAVIVYILLDIGAKGH